MDTERIHTIQCQSAEERAYRGEQIRLSPGLCWCGLPLAERKQKPARRRRA